MIIDRIENAHLYYGMGAHIDAALRFLQEGKTEGIDQLSLDNGNVIIRRLAYDTRPMEQCNKENHRLFADIHVGLDGVELFGYCNRKNAVPINEYDPETDKQLYDAKMSYIRLLPSMFALTLPEDVHSALLMEDKPSPGKKLIIKCRL